MRAKEENRRTVGGRAAAFGGLMIAVVAFSVGILSASSHKSPDARTGQAIVRTQTSTTAATEALEAKGISPSDNESEGRRLPAHPELDLQLD